MTMSATTSGSCSRHGSLLGVSLCKLSYWSCHDRFGMELLPPMWQQILEIIFGGFLEVRHRGNHGVEVKPWVDVVVAACRKQRLYHTHVLSRLMVSAEEIVLASERYRPNFVLGKVVVKQKPSVVKHTHHGVPPGIGVGDSLARK